MENVLPVIRAALGVVAALAVLSLALVHRHRRGRTTNLGLWSPAAWPQGVGTGTTPRAK